MSWKHPSDEQLARWAEGGSGRRVADHAVGCRLCERRLEAITALEPRIREELAASLEPATTFEDRLRERLNQRLLDQETIEILLDLVDVGPEATSLLLGPEERVPDEHGPDEHGPDEHGPGRDAHERDEFDG